MIKNIKSVLLVLVLLVATSALAFTEPACGPTGCNAPEPINVSGNAQVKTGLLGLGGLILQFVGDLSFGTAAPTGQFLTTNETGTAIWAPAGGGSGGFWAAVGNNISNTNSGNVGIGISSPNANLDVASNANTKLRVLSLGSGGIPHIDIANIYTNWQMRVDGSGYYSMRDNDAAANR